MKDLFGSLKKSSKSIINKVNKTIKSKIIKKKKTVTEATTTEATTTEATTTEATTTVPITTEATTTVPITTEATTTVPITTIATTTIPITTIATTTTEATTTQPEIIIPITTIPITTIPITTIPTTISQTVTPLNVIQQAINTWDTTKIPAGTIYNSITKNVNVINEDNNIQKPTIKNGETYCYRDVETMKIICDNSIGSVDYNFKNPSSYQLNLSLIEVNNMNKVTTPLFETPYNQVKYCKLLCHRNSICQGFKSVYDTEKNSYYCDFYKTKINFTNNLKETSVLKGLVRPNTEYSTGNWSYLT